MYISVKFLLFVLLFVSKIIVTHEFEFGIVGSIRAIVFFIYIILFTSLNLGDPPFLLWGRRGILLELIAVVRFLPESIRLDTRYILSFPFVDESGAEAGP